MVISHECHVWHFQIFQNKSKLWQIKKSSELRALNDLSRLRFHIFWSATSSKHTFLNTLRPRRNGRHFPDGIFRWIFLNENVWISINISLKFVPRGPISNIPSLVQVMAWRRPGDKPLSEPMMVRYRSIYASLGLNELTVPKEYVCYFMKLLKVYVILILNVLMECLSKKKLATPSVILIHPKRWTITYGLRSISYLDSKLWNDHHFILTYVSNFVDQAFRSIHHVIDENYVSKHDVRFV